MGQHVCPWWGGYFIDNRLRRWFHDPLRILAPYIKPGMIVMDFGCGMGMFSIALAQLVGSKGKVVAVDVQQKMLDVLQKRAQKANVLDRIHTHRCELDSLGLHEPIDFVLAFYSAHEVPDMDRLLGEIHGCLRPQGEFMVVEPIVHVSGKSFQAMLVLAEEIGFRQQQRPHVLLSRAVIFVKD
jgi:ubiquinone/menaquinone biosynthesis C-methylase UbiE